MKDDYYLIENKKIVFSIYEKLIDWGFKVPSLEDLYIDRFNSIDGVDGLQMEDMCSGDLVGGLKFLLI